MKLGFTGTRHGMSAAQKIQVAEFLDTHKHEIRLAIHGDCKGADEEFHALCVERGIRTWAKPGFSVRNPQNTSLRAFCKAWVIDQPQSHLARDREIVQVCHVLLACPYSEEQKGGTWYTVKYARKMIKMGMEKTVIVFAR